MSAQFTTTGLHEAQALAGQHMLDNLEHLQGIDQSAYRDLVDTGFGQSLALSGTEYREYALRTVAMLAAVGDCGDQLDIYLEAAIKHGATEAEILSVLDQASQYTGFPRAVNAMRKARDRLAVVRFSKTPVRETLVQLDDHETMVRDTGGSGVPLVLIHALCMDGQMFQAMTPHIVAADPNVRVIAYDMRGHGRARGAPLTKSLEHLVADAITLFDRLGIQQADVVGSSYGGAVAQFLAILHPERVRALCPMATGPEGNPELQSRADRADRGEMPELCTEAIIRWFLPETIANNSWCVRYARYKLDHVRTAEWSAAWRAMAKLDALERIKHLKCPILVLAGEKDLSGTPARMYQIQQACLDAGKRNSTYVEIKDGTHMMPMEAPEAVATALSQWRKEVDSSTK